MINRYEATSKSSQATVLQDCAEMRAAVSDLVGLPDYLIRARVATTWRDGITYAEWLDKAVPDTQALDGVWL